MTLAKDMAGLAVGMGSLSLVAHSAKMIKNPKPKKMVKGFMDLTVGTALLVPTASLANSL